MPFEDQLRKEDVLALKHHVAALKMAAGNRSTNTLNSNGTKHRGLRVKVNGRTLFVLDSFSAEIVNVRKGLARHIFKWPPVVANVCHLHLKSVIWRSSTDVMWGTSTQVIHKLGKMPHRDVNWFRHVEFSATTFLKTPSFYCTQL